MAEQRPTSGSFFCASHKSPDCHRELHLLASMSAQQDYVALEQLGWKRTSKKGIVCPACAEEENGTP